MNINVMRNYLKKLFHNKNFNITFANENKFINNLKIAIWFRMKKNLATCSGL